MNPRHRPPSAWLVFLAAGVGSFVLMGVVRGWMLWVYLAVTVAVVCAGIVLMLRRGARHRGLALAAGWLGPPIVVVGAFLWMSGAVGDYFLTSAFDAAVWRAKADAELTDRTRLRMVDDLRASGRLDRLTQAEVRALLGEPTEPTTADAWVFVVGRAPTIGPDLRFLRVRFGPDGRVVHHELFNS